MPKRKQKSSTPILLAIGGGFLLIVAAILLATQNAPAAPTPAAVFEEDTYPEISRVSLDKAKAALDSGSAIFVDVRSAEAYQVSHIAGAINIPLAELEARLGELDPNQWIITYLIALVFVFGAAGVTVAAAQQGQPGEALYAPRTRSTQILRQQDKTQIQADEIETGAYDRTNLQNQEVLQMQSGLHEQEAVHQTPQGLGLHDPGDHSGTIMQGGKSDRVIEANHEGNHTHQEHNRNDSCNDGNHQGHD